MVSRDERRVKLKKQRCGDVVNVYVQRDRNLALNEPIKAELAAQRKQSSQTAKDERAAALKEKAFEVGQLVTDGRISGRIAEIDERTGTIYVKVGRTRKNFSPIVLKQL